MESIFYLTIGLLFVAGYYSLVTYPKQRDFRKHQDYVMGLNVGDEVITHSGIVGVITELDSEVGIARVKIAEGIEVRMIAAAIIQAYDPVILEENLKKGQ